MEYKSTEGSRMNGCPYRFQQVTLVISGDVDYQLPARAGESRCHPLHRRLEMEKNDRDIV